MFCQYQEAWLKKIDPNCMPFESWVQKCNNSEFKVGCLYCNINISLSTMGKAALSQHARQKNHIKNMEHYEQYLRVNKGSSSHHQQLPYKETDSEPGSQFYSNRGQLVSHCKVQADVSKTPRFNGHVSQDIKINGKRTGSIKKRLKKRLNGSKKSLWEAQNGERCDQKNSLVKNFDETNELLPLPGISPTLERCGKEWYNSEIKLWSDCISALKERELVYAETGEGKNPNLIRVRQQKWIERDLYAKAGYCVYCKLDVRDLPEHWYALHSEEKEVAEIMVLPTNSKEKFSRLRKLRNKGNFWHNLEVLKTGQGELITGKRPPKGVSYKNFEPCLYCLAFLVKKDIEIHTERCNTKYIRIQVNHSPVLEKIIPRMTNDEVTSIIRNDELIASFGAAMCNESYDYKTSLSRGNYVYISQKLRNLGRLVMQMKILDSSVSSLKDAIDSAKFDTFLTAVRNICQYNEKSQTYGNYRLALKFGWFITGCAKILREKGLAQNCSLVKNKVDRFLYLMRTKWEPDRLACQKTKKREEILSSRTIKTNSRKRKNFHEVKNKFKTSRGELSVTDLKGVASQNNKEAPTERELKYDERTKTPEEGDSRLKKKLEENLFVPVLLKNSEPAFEKAKCNLFHEDVTRSTKRHCSDVTNFTNWKYDEVPERSHKESKISSLKSFNSQISLREKQKTPTWSKVEKKMIIKHFGKELKMKKLPHKQLLVELVQNESLFIGRSWHSVEVLCRKLIVETFS